MEATPFARWLAFFAAGFGSQLLPTHSPVCCLGLEHRPCIAAESTDLISHGRVGPHTTPRTHVILPSNATRLDCSANDFIEALDDASAEMTPTFQNLILLV